MKNRATPREINRSDDNVLNEWLATETDPRKILELLGLESHNCNPTLFERGKAAINILISEQQVKSAEKLERQTRHLVCLTWAIVSLTFVLLLFTIYLYQDAHTAAQREQTTQQHSNK
jgi:cytoskeletal protein RodZ